MNEDFGGDIITISDEDGNEFDLELLDTIEFEGQTYCVFVPADIENMDVNDPDYGLIFLKSREENGEELFDSVDDDDELVIISTAGDVIRTSVKDIRTVGRNTMGVTVKKVAPGEKVASVARALAETKEEKVTESAPTEMNVAPADRPAPDAEPYTEDGEE